jgi:hypothetical protein
MIMKTGFIWLFGALFIFVVGQTALYAGETLSIWWKIPFVLTGIPSITFLWLSLTSGGDARFITRLPLPRPFREIIIVAGRGYRESFSWMYKKRRSYETA